MKKWLFILNASVVIGLGLKLTNFFFAAVAVPLYQSDYMPTLLVFACEIQSDRLELQSQILIALLFACCFCLGSEADRVFLLLPGGTVFKFFVATWNDYTLLPVLGSKIQSSARFERHSI